MHTPSFRYHDLPYQDCLNKVGTVTLQDYRDDLVALIESLNQPPLLLGHSLGFLVAQMAAKSNHASLFRQTLFTLVFLEKSHSAL